MLGGFIACRRCHRCGDDVFLCVFVLYNTSEEKIKYEQPKENRGYVVNGCHDF